MKARTVLTRMRVAAALRAFARLVEARTQAAMRRLPVTQWTSKRALSSRRRLLLGLAVGSWFGPGRAQGRADGTPDPDRGLTTLQLHNDQETTQAAGFLSPMFGQSFRQGDMPAGKFPRFVTANGKTCAATFGGISSWPDGSMEILRRPSACAGPGGGP
jgi:hypothetical protein